MGVEAHIMPCARLRHARCLGALSDHALAPWASLSTVQILYSHPMVLLTGTFKELYALPASGSPRQQHWPHLDRPTVPVILGRGTEWPIGPAVDRVVCVD